jgi:hypothetical protein
MPSCDSNKWLHSKCITMHGKQQGISKTRTWNCLDYFSCGSGQDYQVKSQGQPYQTLKMKYSYASVRLGCPFPDGNTTPSEHTGGSSSATRQKRTSNPQTPQYSYVLKWPIAWQLGCTTAEHAHWNTLQYHLARNM